MGLLSDSDAVFDATRVLGQHQALLSHVQAILDGPAVQAFAWLDLACGRGQLFSQLETNIKSESRKKITCYLYDAQNEFLKEAQRQTQTLGFKDVQSTVGDVLNFRAAFPETLKFDFISCTNAFHEIAPKAIPGILFEAVHRLAPQGVFCAYDMEYLPQGHNELGAVAWKHAEISDIIDALFSSLGIPAYRPSVQQWKHSSCNGWSVQIQRAHINSSDTQLRQGRASAVISALAKVRELLTTKLVECRSVLSTLTECGSENTEEQNKTQQLLYDYWALCRSLEALP